MRLAKIEANIPYREDTAFKDLIRDKLANIKENQIHAGDKGNIVAIDDQKCVKYHRFKYDPNEYDVLVEANRLDLAVPKVYEEYPDLSCFAMERLNGKNLEQLFAKGYRFSEDQIEELESISEDFCMHFKHNDFSPRNIFVKNYLVDENTKRIIDCDFVIIDFDRARFREEKDHVPINQKDRSLQDHEKVRGWFMHNRY